MKNLSEIKIGTKIISVFGSAWEQVAVVIGINSDGTFRIAKDAITCRDAENISLPLPFGLHFEN